MEEPPKVERIVSSKGVSIADAASLLKSFLSKIDQYDGNHHHDTRENDDDFFHNNDGLFGLESRKDNTVAATATATSTATPRKSWEEREEEALIAQMDKLANANNNSSGISDDVLERLRMITKSICAEVDGKHLSASGMLMNAAVSAAGVVASSTREELHYFNEGQQQETSNYFSDKSRDDPIDDSWEQQHQPQHPHIAEIEVAKTKKDKKKEKKAKKAAKKARKEAKRQRIK
jgi:hypothetical protein